VSGRRQAFDRYGKGKKAADNRFTGEGRAVQLACDHLAFDSPVVIFSDGRKMYDCPEGCGLQKTK